jgi:hypothetical protein
MARPLVALPTWIDDKLAEDGLMIPSNKASGATSMRSTEDTKRINLGFSVERKTVVISSSLTDK